MRSILLFVCAPLCLICALACRDRSAGPVADPVLAVTLPASSSPMENAMDYSLVIRESFINWKGMHVIGGNGHQGYIKPLMGALAYDANGEIGGGYFELDMNTITLTDKKDTSNDNGLVSHLKNPDFFDVAKHPKALFRMIRAVKVAGDSSYYISGDLTLKAITRDIQFPATIQRNGEDIVASASFAIDRTRWGITYKSGSLFGLMKDELLEDKILVSLVLHFQKDTRKKRC